MTPFDFLEFGGQLSLPTILLYLAAYFVVERAVKEVFQHFSPELYDQLRREKKDAQIFAFIMGMLITAVSTPICLKALKDSNDSNDVLGNPNLSKAGQICIASRSILWASELNRLDHSNVYIAHHLSSMGYLVYHMQSKFPLRIIYAFYASLLTELLSDLTCILTVFGFKPDKHPFAYRIQVANTLLLVLLRIPPIIYAATFLPMNVVSDPALWANIICLFVYGRFLSGIIFTASTRLQILKVVCERPMYVRVAQSFDVSVYGVLFALASFVTALLSKAIYSQSNESSTGSSRSNGLNIQLLLSGFAGLFGARIPFLLGRYGLWPVFSPDVYRKSHLWIQSGIAAVAASIFASPLTGRSRLLFSFCLALPFGEAIGRIGCYFAGCCGGSGDHRIKIPLQLKSSFWNAVAGVALLSLHTFSKLQLETAAMVALAANGIIRILLRPNSFAAAQFTLAIAFLGFSAMWLPRRTTEIERNLQNQTYANFEYAEKPKDGISTAFKTLYDPWAAILAFLSLAAGGFVQWCSGGAIAIQHNTAPDGERSRGWGQDISGTEAQTTIHGSCRVVDSVLVRKVDFLLGTRFSGCEL